jgi:hypothetical protein
MKKIFVLKSKGTVMSGPYDIESLKERGIKPTEKVWWEGLPDWLPAQEVPEFADFIREKTLRSSDIGGSKPNSFLKKLKRAIGFQ